MDERPTLSLAEQVAAAQDWWREAGVDCLFTDDPAAWLTEKEAEEDAAPKLVDRPPARQSQRPPEPPTVQIGGNEADWPRDLSAFREWWLAEPSLDEGGGSARVAPRGPAEAALMVLVPAPEAADGETLLSGPYGRLIGNMLSAMGTSPEHVYLAAALPRHTPLPDWPGLAAAGMGKILLHHIALVRPERLLVLGNVILPLLGHDPAQSPAQAAQTAIQGGHVPTLVARGPDYLLSRTDARAALWQRWLEWTGPK